jgi:hypothetical protein
MAAWERTIDEPSEDGAARGATWSAQATSIAWHEWGRV